MNTETVNQKNVEFDGGEQFFDAASVPGGNRLVVQPEEINRVRIDGANGHSAKNGAPKGRLHRRHAVLGIVALVAAVATGTYYYELVAPFESTDDAFIEAHVTPIAPQVAGRVARLFVRDNQLVKAGDVLLQIDPSDYLAKLNQALAGLAAAKGRLQEANAQLAADRSRVAQEKANVAAAKAEAAQAAADYKRYESVGDLGVSASQLDLAGTKASATQAGVQAAEDKELAAEAQVNLDKSGIQTAGAEVQKSTADVQQAELNLSYTRLKAPENGYITHRTVEAGAYVQTGQPLLAIVPQQVWVVANFKETQLTHMRTGQPVTVKVDAYPQIKFAGHVDSIQHGSGASFSLLPPENASGNYVKVVQRVPVKIVLDRISDAGVVLGPGMSVEPEVRVN
ncbi:MAG: HlyD family secretion protein [Verrucomicrobia bacterium]|nr:HlyD family secretion protein [Verrucomicrobiota bacterium]MDE3099851.1 HlyD family secretion protein [Verrucomicrobiota bacterium]